MIEIIPIFACPSAFAAMTVGELFLATAAMQGIATGASYIGQKKAAKRQEAYQNHLADMQQEAGQRRVATLQTKALQDQRASAQKIEAARQESARVAAQSRLSAEAGGIAGVTSGHIIQVHEAQEGRYIAALQEEQKMRDINVTRMSEDIMMGASQQMASTQAPVSSPNLIASLMQFGAGVGQSALAADFAKENPANKTSELRGKLSSGPATSFKPTGRKDWPQT